MTPNPIESWEEELDEKYYAKINTLSDNELWKFCRGIEVKEIVGSLLAAERATWVEKIEGMEKEYNYDDETYDYITLLETKSYKQALNDVINLIKGK